MAISVPTKEAIPYVLEADRSNPVDLQTVFWIVPRTQESANRALAKYTTARTTGPGGRERLDAERQTEADFQSFVATVSKVEHFLLDPDSDAVQISILAPGGDQAPTATFKGRTYYTVDATTRSQLTAIAKVMSVSDMNEVFSASMNMNTLREGERREL